MDGAQMRVGGMLVAPSERRIASLEGMAAPDRWRTTGQTTDILVKLSDMLHLETAYTRIEE